ncbi:enoyl-CoA hydratase-related protein [Ramlibacter sp. WS9]|uniref:enoyl-CoA hydratase-related protein n=1 Tax=Ramlibacter sp. WS9 TaxID=1882741 RepID=UPI0011414B1B|nr:enoyl-CoA hydratase-related protein [Ramlibacter sp. WS9]ROZ68756.1 enoyl-CoA hydratase [Ramlibacter sp. WS9]
MEQQTQTTVSRRHEGRICVLTLCTGPKANPLTIAVQRDLLAILGEVSGDPSVGALVLTGAGRTFCTGADLSSMGEAGPPGSPTSVGNTTGDVMRELTNPLVLKLRDFPVPVVIALNGAAAGAGVGLALSGDFLLAGSSAFFYLPFMPNLGIVPDMGSSWFLTRQLGVARATALMLLGERLPAEQARQWGLVHAVVPDGELLAQAMMLAARLAALPAGAAREIRALVDAALSNTLPAQLDLEAARQRVLIDGPDFAEGVRAFIGKRPPLFTVGAPG